MRRIETNLNRLDPFKAPVDPVDLVYMVKGVIGMHDSQENTSFQRDARRACRSTVPGLTCSLGEVEDLSVHGMRVRCLGKCLMLAGQQMDVILQLPQGAKPVGCWIRWVKKTALFQYEIGVQFVEEASSRVVILEFLGQTDGTVKKQSA